jgi:type VI secretion system protein ImpF
MLTPEKQRENFQIPLMYAFRDAFEKGDASKQEDLRVDGERVLSSRGSLRRRAADESLLRHDLAVDLAALLDTIDLASVVDLDGLEYVKRSILNYGLDDITHLTTGSASVDALRDRLRDALLRHEPRLTPDTLAVEEIKIKDDVDQRVQFNVYAHMVCRPLDVPVEFVAELDVGAAKVALPRPPG